MKYYNVDNIIRIGTMGAYSPDLKLFDVILNNEAYSESTYALLQNGYSDKFIKPSDELNQKLKNAANRLKVNVIEGRIYSTDVFYKDNDNFKEIYDNYGCLGVEMESFALFHNAKALGKNAACLLTVSDSFVIEEKATSEQREKSLGTMIEIALESITE